MAPLHRCQLLDVRVIVSWCSFTHGYFAALFQGDVTKAIFKLKAALDWRQEFGVADIVQACSENPPNEMTPVIQKENETSKLYVRGYDKEGRALLYMRPAKENTHETSPINNMRHLVWNLEKAIACSAKNGQSKVCIVIDYDQFQLRHAPPMSTSRYTLDILQKHYPERMHKAYICNPPFVFRYVFIKSLEHDNV